MAFICENTGSRKGHKVTLWLFKTREWYTESALETFMRTTYPAELRHRWVSFRGDGYNIVGDLVIRAHGAPLLQLAPDSINDYMAHLDNGKKKALYDQLSKNDFETTKRICDEVMRGVIYSDAVAE